VSLLDDVTPEMDAYRDEIFGRSSPSFESPATTTRSAREREPYGNGRLFARQRRRTSVQFDVNVGMVGINVPSSVQSRTTRSAAEGSLFGDRHITGPRHRLLHADESGHEPLAKPQRAKVDIGFADAVVAYLRLISEDEADGLLREGTTPRSSEQAGLQHPRAMT
jgi:hypothetical protein